MLLGDVIAGLEDEAFAEETLIAMGDLTLSARIAGAAAAEGMARGEFIAAAVGTYAAGCADDEWLTVIGQMGRTADPGQVLVRRALEAALLRAERGADCGSRGGASCQCGSRHD